MINRAFLTTSSARIDSLLQVAFADQHEPDRGDQREDIRKTHAPRRHIA